MKIAESNQAKASLTKPLIHLNYTYNKNIKKSLWKVRNFELLSNKV